VRGTYTFTPRTFARIIAYTMQTGGEKKHVAQDILDARVDCDK